MLSLSWVYQVGRETEDDRSSVVINLVTSTSRAKVVGDSRATPCLHHVCAQPAKYPACLGARAAP